MTEQELTARELVIRFQFQRPPLNFDVAKNCALVAVDETLKVCNNFYTRLSYPAEVKSDGGYICFKKELEYWKEVKSEIEKL